MLNPVKVIRPNFFLVFVYKIVFDMNGVSMKSFSSMFVWLFLFFIWLFKVRILLFDCFSKIVVFSLIVYLNVLMKFFLLDCFIEEWNAKISRVIRMLRACFLQL